MCKTFTGYMAIYIYNSKKIMNIIFIYQKQLNILDSNSMQTLSSQVLSCILIPHYITTDLDEYLKFGFLQDQCQALVMAQRNICQLCVILATGSQNLDRLNRRPSFQNNLTYLNNICCWFMLKWSHRVDSYVHLQQLSF